MFLSRLGCLRTALEEPRRNIKQPSRNKRLSNERERESARVRARESETERDRAREIASKSESDRYIITSVSWFQQVCITIHCIYVYTHISPGDMCVCARVCAYIFRTGIQN